mmetsp:Transcript_14794/g.25367  ORF Transcript_14794/g.25367 Transcript_14794/m.25367 type:complete len:406 (+) Transcript_14794:28-1245(+)
MRTGVGSHSSSGGGGSSFGRSHHHHHHHHNRNSYHSRNRYNSYSSFSGYNSYYHNRRRGGSVCCIVLLFAAIISCFAIAPWPSTTNLTVVDLEQHLIDKSTTLYDAVTIQSVSNPSSLNIAKYNVIPNKIMNSKPTIENVTWQAYSNEHQYYAFSLMAGSTVDVEWHVTNSASLVFMYVFDSKASYDKWKRDPYSNSWLFKQQNSNSRITHYRYTFANDNTDAYFVFATTFHDHVRGAAQFTMNAARYDTSHPVQTCRVYPCRLALDYGSTQVVIIDGLSTPHTADERTVRYQVTGRTAFYAGIASAIIFVMCCCTAAMVLWAKRATSTATYQPLPQASVTSYQQGQLSNPPQMSNAAYLGYGTTTTAGYQAPITVTNVTPQPIVAPAYTQAYTPQPAYNPELNK